MKGEVSVPNWYLGDPKQRAKSSLALSSSYRHARPWPRFELPRYRSAFSAGHACACACTRELLLTARCGLVTSPLDVYHSATLIPLACEIELYTGWCALKRILLPLRSCVSLRVVSWDTLAEIREVVLAWFCRFLCISCLYWDWMRKIYSDVAFTKFWRFWDEQLYSKNMTGKVLFIWYIVVSRVEMEIIKSTGLIFWSCGESSGRPFWQFIWVLVEKYRRKFSGQVKINC